MRVLVLHRPVEFDVFLIVELLEIRSLALLCAILTTFHLKVIYFGLAEGDYLNPWCWKNNREVHLFKRQVKDFVLRVPCPSLDDAIQQ